MSSQGGGPAGGGDTRARRAARCEAEPGEAAPRAAGARREASRRSRGAGVAAQASRRRRRGAGVAAQASRRSASRRSASRRSASRRSASRRRRRGKGSAAQESLRRLGAGGAAQARRRRLCAGRAAHGGVGRAWRCGDCVEEGDVAVEGCGRRREPGLFRPHSNSPSESPGQRDRGPWGVVRRPPCSRRLPRGRLPSS